jgi:spore germination protein
VQNLAPATAAPAAAPPAVAIGPPLASRENFAFAPYWTLPQSGSFDLSGLSTLAYFALGVSPDGSLEESGPGWNGYESQALSDLITRAHAGGERVVLTVNDFDQGSLNALTSSPTAPTTLAAALIPLLEAKNLDGVNFDFEGQGSQDRGGLTNLVAVVSTTLRRADPHWQITMETYASSAGNSVGFYDVPALAPFVDAFFVMAYGLNVSATPTAASPLTSSMFSDLTTLEQYTAVVPAAKVILGTPFFGIEWPTSNGTLGAQATGAATDITNSLLWGGADPQYWDPVTDTGWTSYQVGDQWEETYYEDPLGLFDVAQLAARFGVRGVGIWALGMGGDDAQMIAALDGVAPAGATENTGPQSTSSSPTTRRSPS